MRSQAKADAEIAPKVCGTDKALDTSVKPEHQSKSVIQATLLLLPKESSSIPGQKTHLQKHPMISEENITTFFT